MRRSPSLPGLALILGLLALPLAAQGAKTPTPHERRQALESVYRALQHDPQFLSFKQQLLSHPQDPALRQKLLQFLPISPLDYLQIDMESRHYEIEIPRVVQEAHADWVRLHEPLARSLYGDAKVDSLLTGWPVDTQEPANNPALLGLKSLQDFFTTGTNRNAAATATPPPTEYQGEFQVAVDPLNPNQIVAASNTWDFAAPCLETISIFYSGDGGATWSYTCAPNDSGYPALSGLCSDFDQSVFGSDPALSWDDSHHVYLNYMLLCNSLFVNNFAMVVARSADGGAHWNGQGVVVNGWITSNAEDKNLYAIDNTPTSPFYGRHYTCWDRNNDEKVAYSTNSGAAWTEVDIPAAPSGGTDLACEMAVEDNGTVHLVFDSLTCGTSTCTDEKMFYTRSTNGGVSWSAPVLVRDFNLAGFSNANCPDPQDDRCINPFGAIGVDNSGGACDGTLYAAFSDYPTGGTASDTDVFVARSTNGGATWSAPVKVNNDGLAGRTQFHPFLQVDPSNGHVVVAWHDARDDAGNDAVDFFVAQSTDCGVTFGPNVQASQPSGEFNNATISSSDENSNDNPNYNPNQYGEYMGLDALGGKAYLAWSDTRHYYPGSATEPQKANLGFAVVDLTGAGPVCGNNVKEVGESCDGTDLGGQTCASQGFSGGTLSCNAGCGSFNVSGCFITTVTATYNSIGAEDGYILESSETSTSGGTATSNDSTTSGLRAGDEKKNKQYRSIVSFDTSALPDTASITSVTLRLRRGTVVGTSPFTILGSLSADVTKGTYSNAALETTDFALQSTASAVCTMSNAATNGSWSECTFNGAGMAAINKTGKTQIRIAFTLDDDNDNSADYVGFYSGENADAASRPQLVIQYQQ
jgi:hypothetical protein